MMKWEMTVFERNLRVIFEDGFFHMANNFHCIGFVSKRSWVVNYQSDVPVNFKYDILDINKKD